MKEYLGEVALPWEDWFSNREGGLRHIHLTIQGMQWVLVFMVRGNAEGVCNCSQWAWFQYVKARMWLGWPGLRVGLSSPSTPWFWWDFLNIHLCLCMSTPYTHLILIVNPTHFFSYFLTTMPYTYHNSSLTHPTQKAWTLSFQPSQKVHQDGAVSVQMMDQMMGILSMPQKNLPHPWAPPECTHLPYALFFPIDSCGTTQVRASAAPSSDPSWGSGIVTMLQLNFISTNASQPQDSSCFNAINLYSHISHNAFELTQCIHPGDWDTIIVGRIPIATGVEKEKWKMFWCWRWVRIERKKADYRFGTANDVVGIVEFDSECRQSARLKMVGVVGFIVMLLGSS